MSDDQSNKNLDPTDHKIEEARKKGQISVSKDLAKVIMLVAVSEVALGLESVWRPAITGLIDLSVRQIGQPFGHSLDEVMIKAGTVLMITFGVFFVLCVPVAFASHWGQFGILIAPESLTPSIDKINPVNGLKQMFSKRKLSELLLTLFKAVLLGIVIYLLVREQLPSILQFAAGEPKDIYFGFIALLRGVLHSVVLVCVALGLIDVAIQKHHLKKSLMMDMEEMKKEYKQSEGDPMVKGMRKQLARQWANDPVAKVKDANAVVVNPTHFAVAMLYDPAVTPAPMVLAKGKDAMAQAMIAEARLHGIPVIRHVWLARTLYATGKPDHFIPKASYQSVAHVYAVVQELKASNYSGADVELESRGLPPDSHAQ